MNIFPALHLLAIDLVFWRAALRRRRLALASLTEPFDHAQRLELVERPRPPNKPGRRPRLRHFPLTVPLLALALSLSLAFTGCADSHANSPAPAASAPAAHFKAGHGLQLSPTAHAFVGLATADFTGSRVPVSAVLRTVKGDFVYVANGGWFLRTPVTLGAADATSFAIADGLYDGDTVVTSGARALWLAELSATNGGVGCADGH